MIKSLIYQILIEDLLSARYYFPYGSEVKDPPAMQEVWIQSRTQEDPLEEQRATHSSILAWKIPWTEEPGGHSP